MKSSGNQSAKFVTNKPIEIVNIVVNKVVQNNLTNSTIQIKNLMRYNYSVFISPDDFEIIIYELIKSYSTLDNIPITIKINSYRSTDDFITFELEYNRINDLDLSWREYIEYQYNKSVQIKKDNSLLLCKKIIELNKGLFLIDIKDGNELYVYFDIPGSSNNHLVEMML